MNHKPRITRLTVTYELTLDPLDATEGKKTETLTLLDWRTSREGFIEFDAKQNVTKSHCHDTPQLSAGSATFSLDAKLKRATFGSITGTAEDE